MKKSLFTLLVLMLFGSVYAQNYDPNSYYQTLMVEQGVMTYHGNNASFMGQIYIDGVPNDNLDIEIGCYDMQDPDFIHLVGGIYGVMESGGVQYEHPVYFLTVYGEANDRIIFKLYDHSIGEELNYVCEEEYAFVVDGIHLNYIWHFVTPKDMVFAGLDNNQWSNVANWTDTEGEVTNRLPMAFENVTIAANCEAEEGQAASITINSGYSLTITGEFNSEIPFTVKDGAQLIAPEGSEYSGTIEKEIQGYGNSVRGNYYFISVPVAEFELGTGFEAAGMLNGDYDLYFFTQNPDFAGEINYDGEEYDETWWLGEWQNYKWYLDPDAGMEGAENFTDGNQINYAYLYANKETTTLSFTGTFYSGNPQYTMLNATGSDWPGYQLVGNPLPCNASIIKGGPKITGFYMMNEQSRSDVIAVEEPIVAPATSLLIKANGGNPATQRRVTFVPSTEEANVRSAKSLITIEVLSDNGILEDRAYVRNFESEDLDKFSLSKEGTKIFIPQNGKKYAAVYAGEAKTMPLCFTSTEGGIHTLTVNVENMNCSYLHLIDNVTGTDIDLLRTPKYSFNADDSNYATRFKLVFDEQATNEIAENFAFISNGELMINNSGEATLQVMDITGRILSTENIQNCYSKSLNLSAGVYVVRLSNGNDVKAQKIVVE